ncbi:MAG TPA: prepilin peptidase [Polyangia bacterium]|nr:prepilin peptidase [Polyangia bacterium]
MWVQALFCAGMAVAAAFDLRQRRLPNRLNLALLLAGLGVRVMMGGPPALGAGLVGAAAGLALLLLPFAAGWMGAGDVKLAVAIGAWLGPGGVLAATLLGLAGGGLLALVILWRGGRSLRREVGHNLRFALLTQSAPEVPRRAREHTIPLAVALSAAAALVMIFAGGIHG